ncbi:MAG: hypothetical protein EA339_05750 [Rhodobacteraceae bacterium]|nr:MAG: hypothetical protein EA339_05750 [Paracoccaceae bacterium]
MLDMLDPFATLHRKDDYHAILQIIGTIGCLIYVGGYLLVQTGRLCGNGIGYAASKLVAASFVLASLVTSFNLASFLIQVSFIAISLYGLWYRLSRRISARLDRRAAASSRPSARSFAHPDILAGIDAQTTTLTDASLFPCAYEGCQGHRQGHCVERDGPDILAVARGEDHRFRMGSSQDQCHGAR